MQNPTSRNSQAIFTYLLITFGLSSIFYFLIINSGKLGSGYGMYVVGIMWCPGISAIITSILLKRKISLLGWRWGDTRLQVWSLLVPLLYAFISYLIVWIVGWGKFYNEDFVKRVSESFGFDKLPQGMVIVLYFILMGFFGMARSLSSALGEEIGWRGFLAPALYENLGFTKTSLITGVIWSVWHYPILIFADYNSGTPTWYGLTCFTVMVISISFVFTWFRIKSNSLWTGAILHASHNLFIQSIFTPLTGDTGNTKYFIDEFGAVLPVVCLCFAIYFWTRRRELSEPAFEKVKNDMRT
jgi:membrane protease YdiL (CAAX protease family)